MNEAILFCEDGAGQWSLAPFKISIENLISPIPFSLSRPPTSARMSTLLHLLFLFNFISHPSIPHSPLGADDLLLRSRRRRRPFIPANTAVDLHLRREGDVASRWASRWHHRARWSRVSPRRRARRGRIPTGGWMVEAAVVQRRRRRAVRVGEMGRHHRPHQPPGGARRWRHPSGRSRRRHARRSWRMPHAGWSSRERPRRRERSHRRLAFLLRPLSHEELSLVLHIHVAN